MSAALHAWLFPASAAANSASHGDETPVRTMLHTWLFHIVLPIGAIATAGGGSLGVVVLMALSIPLLSIVQGATGILGYRARFGDAPLPLSPSHGVVIVHPNNNNNTMNHNNNNNNNTAPRATTNNNAVVFSSDRDKLPIRLQQQNTQSYALSLGCQCGLNHTTATTNTGSTTQAVHCEPAAATTTTTTYGRTSSPATCVSSQYDVESDDANKHPSDTTNNRPLRLLVIGDSLAIGVGQARQCTPVLPEVLAKALSARLSSNSGRGRVVYWTCHGAPGASTGWIVRELERGANHLQKQQTEEEQQYTKEEETATEEEKATPAAANCESPSSSSSEAAQSICSDTEESSSDESAVSSTRPMPHASIRAQQQQQQRAIWRERLAQHRKRFDPEALGPYDIVVVMTGSNDLKSAFFPFLLTGEDAEFRRQAAARGGSYAKELRRLLETLNRGMRSSLENIRVSVGAATETVIEKVEETMERIIVVSSSSSSPVARKMSPRSGSFREKLVARKENSSNSVMSRISETCESNNESKGNSCNTDGRDPSQTIKLPQTQFPLVVLPGMPSRALPAFRKFPLQWLAIPMVDIMDTHKRHLAKSHPGEVLFVPPPSIDDLAAYENGRGEFWRQRCQEDTVLTLRDVRRMDCRRIESELREYYERRDDRVETGVGLVTQRPPAVKNGLFSFFPRPPSVPASSLFSVDQVHPTDDGYDFWGRYIANAIADEWIAANPSKACTGSSAAVK